MSTDPSIVEKLVDKPPTARGSPLDHPLSTKALGSILFTLTTGLTSLPETRLTANRQMGNTPGDVPPLGPRAVGLVAALATGLVILTLALGVPVLPLPVDLLVAKIPLPPRPCLSPLRSTAPWTLLASMIVALKVLQLLYKTNPSPSSATVAQSRPWCSTCLHRPITGRTITANLSFRDPRTE